MKKLIALCFVAFVIPLLPASGQETAFDMVGIWQPTSGATVTHEGFVEGGGTTVELEILEQNGSVFRGEFRWEFPEAVDHLHDGRRQTNAGQEEIIGALTADGTTFVIADHPDQGYMFGSVVDADTIELILVESGEFAFAAQAIFERQ